MKHYQHSFPPEPVSFSFDNPLPDGPPQRTISKCLKLKTHESMEEQGLSSIELKQDLRVGLNIEESQIDSDRGFRLIQGEYELRVQSLIKQYELRLTKQEEYYALKEWKLKEQIQNISQENLALADELRKAKTTQRSSQSECSICSDGKVIAHYHKVLAQNQEHHQGCLQEKKELSLKVEQLQAKADTIEEEHQKVYDQLRKTQRMLRNCQMKLRQAESDRDTALQSISELDSRWRQKMDRAEADSKQFQRELAQRDIQLTQSKATVVSSQSTFNRASLKSSLLKSRDPLQNKQNQFGRGRASLNKIVISDDQQDSDLTLNKSGENCAKNNNWVFRQQPMRWKYF